MRYWRMRPAARMHPAIGAAAACSAKSRPDSPGAMLACYPPEPGRSKLMRERREPDRGHRIGSRLRRSTTVNWQTTLHMESPFGQCCAFRLERQIGRGALAIGGLRNG